MIINDTNELSVISKLFIKSKSEGYYYLHISCNYNNI